MARSLGFLNYLRMVFPPRCFMVWESWSDHNRGWGIDEIASKHKKKESAGAGGVNTKFQGRGGSVLLPKHNPWLRPCCRGFITKRVYCTSEFTIEKFHRIFVHPWPHNSWLDCKGVFKILLWDVEQCSEPLNTFRHWDGVKGWPLKALAFSRVALVVLDFKDLTLHSTVPRGSNALRMRLLKRLGYAVLEVSIHLLLSLTLASFFPTWAVADEKRMKLNKLLFCDVWHSLHFWTGSSSDFSFQNLQWLCMIPLFSEGMMWYGIKKNKT